MPPCSKINREDVIKAGITIVKKEGLDNLNARKIADLLGCSTQPIFTHFESMEQIRDEVMDYIGKKFDSAMRVKNFTTNAYKDYGLNYINFAKREPTFYKILFASGFKKTLIDCLNLAGTSEKVLEVLMKQTGLTKENAIKFHRRMWIFSTGIATLIVNKSLKLDFEDVSKLLSEQYINMIRAEVEKGNIKPIVLEMTIKNQLVLREDQNEK